MTTASRTQSPLEGKPDPRSKPRLLVISEAVRPTGYARVAHSLIPDWLPYFEVIHYGVNYAGPPLHPKWAIVPNPIRGDRFGKTQLAEQLVRYEPDLIWICHDWELYAVLSPIIRRHPRYVPTILYTPLATDLTDAPAISRVFDADRLVLYTESSLALLGEFARSHAIERTSPISVLPHGVDGVSFYPLGAPDSPGALRRVRHAGRAGIFPDRPELKDAFIVLNANRNTYRKRLDITMKAFARFAAQKPDAYLCLHTGLRDQGVDVLQLAHELGIAARLLLTADGNGHPSFDAAQLNLLYNACDVGVNTALAEGWGLVSFEHAATCAAQLLPALETCQEIWGDAASYSALAWDPRDTSFVGDRIVDAEALAIALEELYASRDLLYERSIDAYRHATRSQFRWTNIAHQWRSLLSEVLRDHGKELPPHGPDTAPEPSDLQWKRRSNPSLFTHLRGV